jgi:hypothetical protein
MGVDVHDRDPPAANGYLTPRRAWRLPEGERARSEDPCGDAGYSLDELAAIWHGHILADPLVA